MPTSPPLPPASRRRGPAAMCAVVFAACAVAVPAWAAGDGAPRLKFRGKGSACMCSDAIDDKTISRALQSRLGGGDATQPPGAADAKPAAVLTPADAKAAADAAARPLQPAAPRASAPADSPAPRSPQEQRP